MIFSFSAGVRGFSEGRCFWATPSTIKTDVDVIYGEVIRWESEKSCTSSLTAAGSALGLWTSPNNSSSSAMWKGEDKYSSFLLTDVARVCEFIYCFGWSNGGIISVGKDAASLKHASFMFDISSSTFTTREQLFSSSSSERSSSSPSLAAAPVSSQVSN